MLCVLILPYSIDPAQDRLAVCPRCGGKVHRHGSRRRQAVTAGAKQWCRILRFLCPLCRKTFTRLPPFLLPFKHYVASEIEGVLRHIFEGGRISKAPSGADESTFRRWVTEFSRNLPQWAGLVETRTFGLLSHALSLIPLLSHPLGRLEKILSGLPALPSDWPVLVQTLWWLKKSHPL